MTRTYGHPAPPAEPPESALRLQFHTDSLPLRWSDCSASAQFISNFYAGVFRAEYGPAEVRDLTHSIAYLANELLENAVKFRAEGDVELEAGLVGREFVLR